MLTLIRNAQVFAPQPLGLCNLLVAGDEIIWIGVVLPVLDGCLEVSELDVQGAFVVPGFIDAHAHVTGGGGETGPASRVPPVALSAFTLAGVTSVVGVLGTDDVTRNTQTLVTQCYGLREAGLSAWCHTGGYHLPLTTLTGSVRSDIAFVDPIIGVGELAISDHRSSQPTLDEFLRVASDAYVGGMMTGKAGIVHCHLGDGERGLALLRAALDLCEIPARVFNPTHVNRNKRLFQEALALTGYGCFIDLTAFPAGHVDPGISAAPAFPQYRSGGYPMHRLTVSSDGGGCLPAFDKEGNLTRFGVGLSATLPQTLQELLGQGVAMQDVLPMLTSNVADLLKLTRKGRLSPGMDADLVVMSDKGVISDVMARGRWHVRDKQAIVLGTFEEAR